jgi:IS605 OrfB family transposase
LKWRLANIVVRVSREKQYAVILEELGEEPAREMINHIGDDQLRHRIYQASFKGVHRAIEEKARSTVFPVIYVNPRNTSRMCPAHNAKIVYSNGCRIGSAPRVGNCGIET